MLLFVVCDFVKLLRSVLQIFLNVEYGLPEKHFNSLFCVHLKQASLLYVGNIKWVNLYFAKNSKDNNLKKKFFIFIYSDYCVLR